MRVFLAEKMFPCNLSEFVPCRSPYVLINQYHILPKISYIFPKIRKCHICSKNSTCFRESNIFPKILYFSENSTFSPKNPHSPPKNALFPPKIPPFPQKILFSTKFWHFFENPIFLLGCFDLIWFVYSLSKKSQNKKEEMCKIVRLWTGRVQNCVITAKIFINTFSNFAGADVFVDSFLKLAERASSNFMGH